MDDRSTVTQKPIQIEYTGSGPFRSIKTFFVPDPPEGCESVQLLDWGSVIAILAVNIDQSRRNRVIEAYASKWGIASEDFVAPSP